MKVRLTHQIPPSENNPRNSEGAFIRGKNGELLFAYSRYTGESIHDHAACDIALIVSVDEGESWSEPRIIATAAEFGVKNIMSVSAVEQENGDIGFYFLIKENDSSSTLGRAVSCDGVNFRVERCESKFPKKYYVVNNDRVIRLKDGRLAAPAAYIPIDCNTEEKHHMPATMTCLLSDDDGGSFYKAAVDYTTKDPVNMRYGFQEPGALEREDGIYMWARTNYGCQYEALFTENFETVIAPRASIFTSPPSPMHFKWVDGVIYAIYNPVPRYNGVEYSKVTRNRTPYVLRKSTDGGESYGPLNIIEKDPERGYCYPAVIGTKDGCLLLAYCRGGEADGNTLCRLGIAKIEIDSIE